MVEHAPEQDGSNPLLLASLATGALIVGALFYSKTEDHRNEAVKPDAIPERSNLTPQDTLHTVIDAAEPVIETNRQVVIVADSPEIRESELQNPVEDLNEQQFPSLCTNIPSRFPQEFYNYRSEWIGHVEGKRISKAAFILDDSIFSERFDPFIDCAKELGMSPELRTTLVTQLQSEDIPEMQQVLLEIIGSGFALDDELWTGTPNLFPTFERVCADHNCNLLGMIVDLFPNSVDLSEVDRSRLVDNLLYAIERSDQKLHTERCLPNEHLPYEITNELKEFKVDLSKQIPVFLSNPNANAQSVGLIALREYYYQRLSEDESGDFDERRKRAENEIRPYLTYLPKDFTLDPQVRDAYELLEKHLAGQVYLGPGDTVPPSRAVTLAANSQDELGKEIIDPDCQSRPSLSGSVVQKVLPPIWDLLGGLRGGMYFCSLPRL